MVELKFKIDKEDDINLWLKFINNSNKANSFGRDRLSNLPKDFLDKVIDKPESEQREIISNYIEQYYTEKHLIKFKVESFNKVKENLDKIIERLEKLHNRKLPVNKIIVKYETFTCCPYMWRGKESDWFGLYFATYVLDQDSQILVFCHEVMHLFFHYYYFDYCLEKGLNEKQTMDLKEAVTVLLNYELTDIIDKKDYGHPSHKQLRIQLVEIWNSMEEKDFQLLLDKAIDNMKGKDNSNQDKDSSSREPEKIIKCLPTKEELKRLI